MTRATNITPVSLHKPYTSIYIPLRVAFGVLALAMGIDKFFNVLTDWSKYLPAWIPNLVSLTPDTCMMIIGAIEIVAALLVLTVVTRLGAYIVMLWLIGITIVEITAGYYDIALRDIVLAVGAYTLGQLAGMRGEPWLPRIIRSKQTPSSPPAQHPAP